MTIPYLETQLKWAHIVETVFMGFVCVEGRIREAWDKTYIIIIKN